MSKIKIFAIITLGIILFALQESVSADPQCLPPYFIECPEDIVTGCNVDTTYVQLKAVHDVKILNSLIRYHLISGPGVIDEKTGLWSFCSASRICRPFEVEVAASILNTSISTSGDNNCHFSVQLDRLRVPVILVEGQRNGGVFMVTAPGSKSVQLELSSPRYCETSLYIDSIYPIPAGDISLDENRLLTFNAAAEDADQRFFVEVIASSYSYIDKCTIIFDTRPSAPVPVFTNCPDTIFTTHCDRIIMELIAVDPEYENPDGVRYHLVSGPGVIADGDNNWLFKPYREDIGQTYEVEIAASYADAVTSGDENCRFTLVVSENYAPNFSWWEGNPCGLELPLTIPGDTMFSIWVKDTNACDKIEFFIADVEPDLSGQIYVEPLSDNRQGVVHINLDEYNVDSIFNVSLAATDHHDTTYCNFTIKALKPKMRSPMNPSKSVSILSRMLPRVIPVTFR